MVEDSWSTHHTMKAEYETIELQHVWQLPANKHTKKSMHQFEFVPHCFRGMYCELIYFYICIKCLFLL